MLNLQPISLSSSNYTVLPIAMLLPDTIALCLDTNHLKVNIIITIASLAAICIGTVASMYPIGMSLLGRIGIVKLSESFSFKFLIQLFVFQSCVILYKKSSVISEEKLKNELTHALGGETWSEPTSRCIEATQNACKNLFSQKYDDPHWLLTAYAQSAHKKQFCDWMQIESLRQGMRNETQSQLKDMELKEKFKNPAYKPTIAELIYLRSVLPSEGILERKAVKHFSIKDEFKLPSSFSTELQEQICKFAFSQTETPLLEALCPGAASLLNPPPFHKPESMKMKIKDWITMKTVSSFIATVFIGIKGFNRIIPKEI